MGLLDDLFGLVAPPEEPDPREVLANRLIDQGHATVEEMMTAAYGVWPPKGLDIAPGAFLARPVTLKLTDLPVSGYIEEKERIVHINRDAIIARYSPVHPTLGHEGFHMLQYDYGLRAEELFGPAAAQLQGGLPLSCDSIAEKLTSFDRTQPHEEFNKAARKNARNVELAHLDTGRELQARLHVVMAEAYQDWQDMPQTKEELWMLLQSSYIQPPEAVAAQLKALPEDARARKFIHRRGYEQSRREVKAVDEVRMFLATLSDAGRAMFWRETAPALYADMIEMYGDRKGRERFGLGPNVTGQVQRAARKNGPGA
jgi:hypothetical protein